VPNIHPQKTHPPDWDHEEGVNMVTLYILLRVNEVNSGTLGQDGNRISFATFTISKMTIIFYGIIPIGTYFANKESD
jgi:hypothetical protein